MYSNILIRPKVNWIIRAKGTIKRRSRKLKERIFVAVAFVFAFAFVFAVEFALIFILGILKFIKNESNATAIKDGDNYDP